MALPQSISTSPAQSVATFAPHPEQGACRNADEVLRALERMEISHHASSKSICIAGSSAVGAFSPDVLAYYAQCAERALCLKLSKSYELIGDHDAGYVWSHPNTPSRQRAWNARVGTARSKLAVGNLLSMHFRHHSNNFCGEDILRYVDSQKLVLAVPAAAQRAQAALGTTARPNRIAAQRAGEMAGAVVADFGPSCAHACAVALAAAARWYYGLIRATNARAIERDLYCAGFSRFSYLPDENAVRARAADVHLSA